MSPGSLSRNQKPGGAFQREGSSLLEPGALPGARIQFCNIRAPSLAHADTMAVSAGQGYLLPILGLPTPLTPPLIYFPERF